MPKYWRALSVQDLWLHKVRETCCTPWSVHSGFLAWFRQRKNPFPRSFVNSPTSNFKVSRVTLLRLTSLWFDIMSRLHFRFIIVKKIMLNCVFWASRLGKARPLVRCSTHTRAIDHDNTQRLWTDPHDDMGMSIIRVITCRCWWSRKSQRRETERHQVSHLTKCAMVALYATKRCTACIVWQSR